MKVSKIKIERYKKVSEAEIVLSGVNVIVGGNNAGKSSALQGIHFAITAAMAARQQGQVTFSSDLLLYNPTPDFSVLRNGSPYLNQKGAANSSLKIYSNFVSEDDQVEESSYSILLYKGRNHGNIGCERDGDHLRIGSEVTNSSNLFCVYVPGLAGIPQHEELRAKAIVRRGVASGDANLYLRNIIYYIDRAGMLDALNSRLASVFPGVSVEVDFREEVDHRINVYISSGQARYPIELSGTGLLQVLQIYTYITYFNPKLLLLDEPDSHLHPDNQSVLCDSIVAISENTETQIILCTHSRHVIDSLSGCANFIWMKDGAIQEQGQNIERLPMLMDLGALDNFDKLRSGATSFVVLTEDRKSGLLQHLLAANNFPTSEMIIYSYKTSSNIESAIFFAEFLLEIAPDCKVIVHRDRDFMTDSESEVVANKILESGAIPFITSGSDIESYYVSLGHLSEALEVGVAEIEAWGNALATEHHNDIVMQFTRKRDEIKLTHYKSDRSRCPDTTGLIGANIPLPIDKRKGKFMLKKIRGGMHERFGREVDLITPTSHLKCPLLEAIFLEIWPVAE